MPDGNLRPTPASAAGRVLELGALVWMLLAGSTVMGAEGGSSPVDAPAAAVSAAAAPAADDAVVPAADTDAATGDATGTILGTEWRETAESIRQLMAGDLPVGIDAPSLFDVPLADGVAIALEAARLRSLLEGPAEAPGDVSPGNWEARRELDAARLAFYALPDAERAALVEAHADRQAADARSTASRATEEARQRAEEAESARREALAAAERARTEAERLIAEEQARLLGVAARIAAGETDLAQGRTLLGERAERTLAFHRRVREVANSVRDPVAADALYDELRAWLRAARNELSQAMGAPDVVPVEVRTPGADPLASLSAQVDRREVDALRVSTETAAASLAMQTEAFQRERARQLHDEVQSLNDDRLLLLQSLSPERRADVVGFGAAGLDQGFAELRQLALVLHYHFDVVSRWVTTGAWSNVSGVTAGVATANFLQILLLVAVFFWGRGVARNLLKGWHDRLEDQARRRRSLEAGRMQGYIKVLLSVFEPASWLLLLAAVMEVLPDPVIALLEVRVLATLGYWILCGWLAVLAFDTLAMRRAARIGLASQLRTDALRLRSLRLLGIAVVVIGSVLSVSALIVGRGTIYTWVWNTCWWTALPIGLVLARWWRETIFERLGYRRRRFRFEDWVLSHRQGWKGVLAAAIGGADLLVRGTWSILKSWLGSFDLTRRLLAYTFRRELDRIVEQRDSRPLLPLSPEMFESLSPRTESRTLIQCSDNAKVAEVIGHIERTGGGVYAVVGERGSGRSTVLHRVSESRSEVTFAECPFDGMPALSRALAAAIGLPAGDDFDSIAAALDARDGDVGIIIDNAHRLVHPVMGGIAAFDQLIDTARRHSSHCAWVLSFDRIVWRFLSRARTLPILFDNIIELDDWTEEEIGALLKARSEQTGIVPKFDLLTSRLPADVHDIERDEALNFAASSYYRLIWDYADGNPGVALHSWRTSLGIADDGSVYVTPFRVPETALLDRMPDAGVFVLRAVLQLERALPADVARATFQPLAEVENSLRYGVQTGFLQPVAGRFAVAWNWYRPITRFLQRRHLLASS